MPKILLKNNEVEYVIKAHPRAKNLRLRVLAEAVVSITVPCKYSEVLARKFLAKHADWVLDKIRLCRERPPVRLSAAEYLRKKIRTKKIILQRIRVINRHYALVFNRITVRRQKSRWGSCSSAGNLNFNSRICDLSERLQDYIITHELCHLRELNHSPAFWRLVAETMPDYSVLRKELRKQSAGFL